MLSIVQFFQIIVKNLKVINFTSESISIIQTNKEKNLKKHFNNKTILIYFEGNKYSQ